MSEQLQIVLTGSDDAFGQVSLDQLGELCVSLTACLNLTQRIVTPDQGKLEFRVAGLSTGSAKIRLEPVAARGRSTRKEEVVQAFCNVVSSIQAGARVDARFDDYDTLTTFRKLSSPLERRAKAVSISNGNGTTTHLTAAFAANIDRLLGESLTSQGSISGKVERLNLRNRSEFMLFPPITNKAITCTFQEDLFDSVISAIEGKRHVTVTGTLHFRGDKPFPEKVNVRSIELHPPQDALPSLMSLRGMAPNCTGDVDEVQFLRAWRDE